MSFRFNYSLNRVENIYKELENVYYNDELIVSLDVKEVKLQKIVATKQVT